MADLWTLEMFARCPLPENSSLTVGLRTGFSAFWPQWTHVSESGSICRQITFRPTLPPQNGGVGRRPFPVTATLYVATVRALIQQAVWMQPGRRVVV